MTVILFHEHEKSCSIMDKIYICQLNVGLSLRVYTDDIDCLKRLFGYNNVEDTEYRTSYIDLKLIPTKDK